MEQAYLADKTFDQQSFREGPVLGTYDSCTFRNCDFAKSDLSAFTFIDCIFQNCNLSQAKLIRTLFRDTQFIDCKMLGLSLDQCNPTGLTMSFEHCVLNFSSFYQVKLKHSRFVNCQLQETDFTGSDVSGSVFENCDFEKAVFDHTILEKADLRTSFNYAINPETNRIRKAKFAWPAAAGLLVAFDIEIDSSLLL